MSEIKAVIIDDEPGNIITLSEMLKAYCPGVVIEGSAVDPIQGEELIQDVNPDLVFLDIEMPYGNAFDLLDRLSPVWFEVIFITAFNDYALKAIKYAALDYILKPVNIDELKLSVSKATKRLEERNINTRISSLVNNFRGEIKGSGKIGLPVLDGFHFEDIDNIMYIAAEGSYTMVYIKGKKKQLVSKSLKEFEEILPGGTFCRIHHSFIININFVKKYTKGRGGHVEMEDGTPIEVSIRKKNDFFERFRH
jgi:two-component system, LytTR family, response regulator